MNKSTVNIADFRGIRTIKYRTAHTPPRSIESNYGLLVLETRSGYCESEAASWNGADQYLRAAVVDIGTLRETVRFGHRSSRGSQASQRGAKVLHFGDFTDGRGTANPSGGEHRGIWNGITDDRDFPPAA